MREALLLVLASVASTCVASAEGRRAPPGPGWEAPSECRKVQHACGATDLPRVNDHEWSPPEIGAFLKRAEQGTVVIERTDGKAKLHPECIVPGAYVSYLGKDGKGRLSGTNRPLLYPDEVGRNCAGATHLVATFARKGARFDAVLVPLPCPPTDDPKPASHCLARGETGAERLERSLATQNVLAPPLSPLHPPRQKKTVAARQPVAAADETAVGEAPKGIPRTTGKILEMWALTPDDYPATRWLGRLSEECALHEQGLWYEQAYGWSGERKNPHTVPLRRRPPAELHAEKLSSTDCFEWPLFIDCFPGLVELEPVCLPEYDYARGNVEKP